jgi:formate hydrogenlyase subunit 6/NADH:ubiquinone oxidoreductase subunit I
MKIGAMLSDVVVSFVRRPITEKYPFERRDTPERLRGHLLWDPENCTGCGLCVKDCPANAIEMFVLDKANKQFVLRYHVDRCTFCAQCVDSCRQDCLAMSSDQWELAAFDRDSFVVYYGDEHDVERVLAGLAEPDAATLADS